MTTESSLEEPSYHDPPTPYLSSAPGSPGLLSRNSSFISRSYQEDWEVPPLDKLNFFDLFDSLALPTRLDKLQAAWTAQKERVRQQQARLKTTGTTAKDRAVAEIRKRVPTADEQLAKYRRRMKQSVDHLSKRWSDTASPSIREKVSFISAVLNVFISGYLIGACPQYFYYWFTAQFFYFMPIRYITYHRKGYHYFLADLCYFVNILSLFSIWAFPQSKRLFIAAYCLAYGNNAVAIAMWRNSLVFHSLDKVTSLFVHIMPPVTLHCIVHLTPATTLVHRFPSVFQIKHSMPGSPEHYTLFGMLIWATVPRLHIRATRREDRRRPAHIVYLAPQILQQDLDREVRPPPTGSPSRTDLHDDSIRLRFAHSPSVSDLVLLPLGICRFPLNSVWVEYMERRELLHGRLWKAVSERAGTAQARCVQMAEQSRRNGHESVVAGAAGRSESGGGTR